MEFFQQLLPILKRNNSVKLSSSSETDPVRKTVTANKWMPTFWRVRGNEWVCLWSLEPFWAYAWHRLV